MTTTLGDSVRLTPEAVREALARHILVDGYHLVQDIERSHGVYLHDAVRGRDVLDFFGHFSTNPVGFNHPKMTTEEFHARILPAPLNKPANSDIYTTQMAEFVETFSRSVPEAFRKHMFFVEGGSVGIENALKTAFDWKVRKNFKKGYDFEKGHQIMHLKECFHERTGYTLSLTNTAAKKRVRATSYYTWQR